MSLSQDEIFEHLKKVLVDLFETPESQITMTARLYDDLDIDSIDTIDLLIELKRILAKKIEPQAFKDARTIADVVGIIEQF